MSTFPHYRTHLRVKRVSEIADLVTIRKATEAERFISLERTWPQVEQQIAACSARTGQFRT
jgi:hypothetical protein